MPPAKAGKIRHLGYSGDNERLAWAVNCPLVDVVEASVIVVDQYNLDSALGTAATRGVAVIAKRPIANAAWRHAENPQAADAHHQLYARRFQHLELDPKEYDCANMAELALRFTISLEEVSCAIVSCTSPQHLAANLETVSKGALQPSARDRLIAAFNAAQLSSAGSWLACN